MPRIGRKTIDCGSMGFARWAIEFLRESSRAPPILQPVPAPSRRFDHEHVVMSDPDDA